MATARTYTRERRKAQGLWSLAQVAREFDEPYFGLAYQIRIGMFPAPAKRQGKRKFYTAAQVEEIRELLKN